MVGTHTFIGKHSNKKLEQLDFLKHESWFRIGLIETLPNISMFVSHYDGYPFIVFQNDKWIVIVEGMIYNLSNEEIKIKCEQVANKFVNNDNYINEIKGFASFCDGDFIVQICDKKSGRYLVFNDYMGRLPLFYSIGKDDFTISRDIKTNIEFASKIEIDLTGVTEFLMLSYSLGNKTFFKNIHRLEPYQAIIFEDINNPKNFEFINTCDISYNRTKYRLNKEEILTKLTDQFLIDTKNRISKFRENKYEVISDLSGGFDSRAIIGALSKCEKNIKYFTFEYIQDESAEAGAAFKALGEPGDYVKLKFNNVIDHSQIEALVYKTNGLVDFLTSSVCYNDAVSLHNYLKQNNRIAHFGGYGGEFLRCPQKRLFKSIFYGLNNRFYNLITIDKAITIFNSSSSIKNEIMDYFEKNYKNNKEGQLRKFYYEYAKVPQAGEERARLFSWSAHPMWSKDWVKTIYEEIPLKWTGYKLFIGFLSKIDKRLLNTPIYKKNELNMNSIKSINEFEKKNTGQLRIKTKIYHTINYYLPVLVIIYERLRNKRLVNTQYSNDVYNTFLRYYDKLQKFNSLFNLDKIEENIHDFGGQYNRLTTLAIYFNEIEKRYLNKIEEPKK